MNPLLRLLAFSSISLAIFIADAQADAKVDAISVNGTAQASVSGVKVGSGNQAVKSVSLSINQTIPGGSRIQTPIGVRLTLLTSNNNLLQVSPNSDIRIAISGKGEQHTVTRGGIFAWVRKKGSFFGLGTSGKRYQGVAHGTAFGLTVDDKGVSFTRTEGSVRVSRQVPVKIAAAKQDNNRRPAPSIGQYTELSNAQAEVYFDPTDEANIPDFQSYEEAINYFSAAYNQAVSNDDMIQAADILSTVGRIQLDAGDADEAVKRIKDALALNYQITPDGLDYIFIEDHTNLGYAYLDTGYPDMALEEFVKAMNIIVAIDSDGPLFAESLLDQVEAYLELNEMGSAAEILYSAIDILQANINFGREIFEEIMLESQGEPTELAGLIALEVGNQLDSLGWAYTTAGDEVAADEAFSEADEIAQMLEVVGIYVDY